MSKKIFDRSEHQKQLWKNPEYRKHMSEAHKGKIGYWNGKKRDYIPHFGMRGHIPWDMGKKRPEVSGDKHWNWKGGKFIHNEHIYILQKEHPFCEHHGYIPRSHLVMEKHLGRYLLPEERVHHKGIRYPINSIENKQDDKIDNLQLFPNEGKHQLFHYKLRKINKLGQFT